MRVRLLKGAVVLALAAAGLVAWQGAGLSAAMLTAWSRCGLQMPLREHLTEQAGALVAYVEAPITGPCVAASGCRPSPA